MTFATPPLNTATCPGSGYCPRLLSAVEIGGGFAYDGTIFRRILSTPSFFVPDRPGKNTPEERRKWMGKNIVQKIIDAHYVSGDKKAGKEVAVRIDQTLTQDANGTMA